VSYLPGPPRAFDASWATTLLPAPVRPDTNSLGETPAAGS
jgi:hypothetical protein